MIFFFLFSPMFAYSVVPCKLNWFYKFSTCGIKALSATNFICHIRNHISYLVNYNSQYCCCVWSQCFDYDHIFNLLNKARDIRYVLCIYFHSPCATCRRRFSSFFFILSPYNNKNCFDRYAYCANASISQWFKLKWWEWDMRLRFSSIKMLNSFTQQQQMNTISFDIITWLSMCSVNTFFMDETINS